MDPNLVEAYAREGYAVFRNVIDPALIEDARRHILRLQKHYGPDSELFQLAFHNDDAFWLKLVGDERLLDAVEPLIGRDVALFNSNYFCKAPFQGQPVLWHQDAAYWRLEPMSAISVWLAIDDSTPENGCMRVIPGTHRGGLYDVGKRPDVKNFLGSGMDEGLVDQDRAVDVVLQAGDISVHHPHIVHGSGLNTSARRRCGLAIRYIPTSTRIVVEDPAFTPIADAQGRWPCAFLLRGRAAPGINTYNPVPEFND